VHSSVLKVGAAILVVGMVVGPLLWRAHGVWTGPILFVLFLVSQLRRTTVLYCPHCRLEVAAAATVCPHCTRDIYSETPMTAGEWIAVVATAAGVSTAVSTALSAYFAVRRRPEADWVLTGSWSLYPADLDGYEPPPRFEGRLVNAGDGAAFRVTVASPGDSINVELRGQRTDGGISSISAALAAVMHPGDSHSVVVTAPEAEAPSAAFTLEWTNPPTHLGRRRRQAFVLSECAPIPRRAVWDETTGAWA